MISEYVEKLASASSFDDIFRLVKQIVKRELGLRRAGLALILMDLPNDVGAFHYIGSNTIVLNKRILDVISRSSSSKIELNSYIFVVLLHEYLHSLGIYDELKIRALVESIVKDAFGENHPAMEFATKLPEVIYPKLKLLEKRSAGGDVEIVRDFDTENTKYIS